MSDSLQTIIERHAAATPGPHHVDVIDQDAGCRSSRNWVISGLAREKYGNNSVSFGEDEKTARFVAAAFTDVPAMAARLQGVHAQLADLDHALCSGEPLDPRLLELVAAGLRNALALEGPA